MSRIEELIARSQAGDREAGELLVEENAGLIWSAARRFLGRGTEIEDLYRKSRSQGFGDEVKRRILLGTFVLSSGYIDAYYKKAMQVRKLICREFSDIFSRYDLILTPTAPHTAWQIGEKVLTPTEMYAEDICTVPASIAFLPALSICCGRDENGLPIGMQLIGRKFEESRLLRAAYAFEQEGAGR